MNRIRDLRTAAGWTQAELGHELGCVGQTVSKLENETRQLDPAMINALCDLFGCTADYLLGRSDIKKPELTDDEFRLVEAFRAADPDLQDLIRRNLKMAKPEDKKAAS